ncbi:IclR family transcriptional regulator [Dietzia cinnamea]|uniref:IclR family transcriptional regulator n=1 Tax=Dietzia cinnamea TaxID=321318 RepID=UPI000D6042F4|nr:IclR family transcriptional regulator [Dietzia cinnamea]MBM7229261.1 IclR family transcriptional regulator [Dietzia cinnamea]MCT1638889.1 IclR family transcriptional regulator [Dietzia cinnamea]MCT2263953.1 IclR family transcriptional regulator [Dietzia cinnamea]PWD96911.1 IclR family transcriptional regulator [Dietzia maris]
MTEPPTSPVDRAFEVLRVTAAGTGMTLSEIARETGLAKSTALRLLTALERNDAVTRIGQRYRLGPLVQELDPIPVSPEYERIRRALTPFLAHLFEATRATVHLATLHGDEVVYLNKLHGPRPIPSPSRIGGGLPAYCTGVGKAMLAFDEDAAGRVARWPMIAWTETTLTSPDALEVELGEIRRKKRAVDRAELTPGLYCVAAPVFDDDEEGAGGTRAVAALSASAADENALARLEPLVTRAAAAAGRALSSKR